MRGKHELPKAKFGDSGITPADAGKTRAIAAVKNLCQDHPRGCGENWQARLKETAQAGSPPRMRGKPPLQKLILRLSRITPADAGKTLSLSGA